MPLTTLFVFGDVALDLEKVVMVRGDRGLLDNGQKRRAAMNGRHFLVNLPPTAERRMDDRGQTELQWSPATHPTTAPTERKEEARRAAPAN